MKFVILSCNTGQGHNSVADAINEELLLNSETSRVLDAFSFISQRFSSLIAKSHSAIYRHLPKAFDKGYRFCENNPSVFEERSIVSRCLKKGAEDLSHEIADADVVISTHPLASLILAEAKRQCSYSFKTAFVATDYTCAPSVSESKMDIYFVPRGLKGEFADNGITSVVESGIPVRREFFSKNTNARRELGIPESTTHVLVMCGSMGCGPIEELAEMLADTLGEEHIVSIVCGSNNKLYKSLSDKFSEHKSFRIYSFTDKVSDLLSSADLFVTKPGGISTSESMAMAVPMALINTVAGCEEHNKNYFVSRNCAVSAEDIGVLFDSIVSLLSSPERLGEMSANLAAIAPLNPQGLIYEALKRM